MTFVLNVLHSDYSLLAADKQAKLVGAATITAGDITIHAKDGGTVEGYHKMKVSRCGAVAIGVAGSVREHGYFEHFEENEGVDSSIKTILDSVLDFFLSPNRKENLSKPDMMRNEGIATFFDISSSEYFSLLYIYTHSRTIYGWWKVANGGARLLHVGTGSSEFEKTIGLEEINRFISSIRNNPDPSVCIEWIKGAFEKVSLAAKGVGREPEFLLSTRSEPNFRIFE